MNKYLIFLFLTLMFLVTSKNVEFFGCPINFRSKIKQAINFVEDKMKALMKKIPGISTIVKFIDNLETMVEKKIQTIKNIKDKIKKMPKNIANAMKKKLSGLKTKIKVKVKSAAKKMLAPIKKIISSAMKKIKSVFKSIGSKLKNAIGSVTGKIKSVFTKIKNAMKKFIFKIKNMGKKIVSYVFRHIMFLKGPLLKIWNIYLKNKWIITAISMIMFLIPSFMQLLNKFTGAG